MSFSKRSNQTLVGLLLLLAFAGIHCADAVPRPSKGASASRGAGEDESSTGEDDGTGAGDEGTPRARQRSGDPDSWDGPPLIDRPVTPPSNGSPGSPGSGQGGQGGQGATTDNASCLRDMGTAYGSPGRFKVARTTVGSVNIYAPTDLPAGCKVPIVHYSNGTMMFCSYYRSHLEHMASWGFLVSCFESTQTGSGEACLTGLDTLVSKFPDHADPSRIGSTGHSQGGGAAITCAYLSEQKGGANVSVAVHAIMPAHGMNRLSYSSEYPLIRAPVFIMSGSTDAIVSDSWIDLGYGPLKTETLWYQAVGVGHMGPNEPASPTSVAYFRWKLLGDQNAAEYIRSLDTMPGWRKFKSK